MFPAIQPQPTVLPSASAGGAPFKAGQVLEALVLGKTPDGLTALKIGDTVLNMQLPQTLPAGTTLQLQVKVGGPAPQLAIIGTQLPAVPTAPVPAAPALPLPAMVQGSTVEVPVPSPAAPAAAMPLAALAVTSTPSPAMSAPAPRTAATGASTPTTMPTPTSAPAVPSAQVLVPLPQSPALPSPPVPGKPAQAPISESGQAVVAGSAQIDSRAVTPQQRASVPTISAPVVPELAASTRSPTPATATAPTRPAAAPAASAATAAPAPQPAQPSAAAAIPAPVPPPPPSVPAGANQPPAQVQQAATASTAPQVQVTSAPAPAGTVASAAPSVGVAGPQSPPPSSMSVQAAALPPQTGVPPSPPAAVPQPVPPSNATTPLPASSMPAPARPVAAGMATHLPAAAVPSTAPPASVVPPASTVTSVPVPPLPAPPAVAEPAAPSPLLVAQVAAKALPTAADLPRPVATAGAAPAQAAPTPATPAAALARMIPEAMMRQNSIAPLLASLASIVARPGAVPEPVLRVALQVLGQRVQVPPSGPTAQVLAAAVAKSGVYLEAGLAKGTPVADLKSGLVALKGALAAWAGATPEPISPARQVAPPLRGLPPRAEAPERSLLPEAPRDAARALHGQADAALSRIKLMQLASLPDGDAPRLAPPELRMEVPFLIGQELVLAQFQVLRDGARRKGEGKRGWTMRFAMNFAATGEVGAEVGLLGRGVNVALWATDPQTAADLEAALPELAPALAAIGLEPGAVRVRALPPAGATPASGQYVDSRR